MINNNIYQLSILNSRIIIEKYKKLIYIFFIYCMMLFSTETLASITFDDIPLENRVKILSYLEPFNFMNAAHSCKALHHAAREASKDRVFRLKEDYPYPSLALKTNVFFSRISVHHIKNINSFDWEYFLNKNLYFIEISVTNSNFNHKALKALNKNINYNNSLKSLSLQEIKFKKKDQKTISNFLRNYNNIELLNLSSNPLSYKIMHGLADGLNNHKFLKTLVLCRCQIDDKNIKNLAYSLSTNNILTTLVLSFNQISNKGAKILASSLKLNQSLSKFYLDNNNIDSNSFLLFLDAMLYNNSLQYLELRGSNIFFIQSIESILEEIRNKKPYCVINF